MLGLLRYALILVCPVMMFFMMRRGHGGDASGAGFGSTTYSYGPNVGKVRLPLAELRRRSDELNAEIVLRELEAHDPGKAEQ
jgi:hypothetical protein